MINPPLSIYISHVTAHQQRGRNRNHMEDNQPNKPKTLNNRYLKTRRESQPQDKIKPRHAQIKRPLNAVSRHSFHYTRHQDGTQSTFSDTSANHAPSQAKNGDNAFGASFTFFNLLTK